MSRLHLLVLTAQLLEDLPADHPVEAQGFGMARIRLNRELRLHLWDKALRNPEVTDIHTHPWDLYSVVLRGSIENERYTEITPEDIFKQGLDLGAKGNIPVGKTDTVPVPSYFNAVRHEIKPGPEPFIINSKAVLLQKRGSDIYGPSYTKGAHYHERKGQIHRTEWNQGNGHPLTLLFREPVHGDSDRAMSYAIGKGWVDARVTVMEQAQAKIYRNTMQDMLQNEINSYLCKSED